MGCFCSKGAKTTPTKEHGGLKHDKSSRSSMRRVVSLAEDTEPADAPPPRNDNATAPMISTSKNLVALQTLSPINIDRQASQKHVSAHQRSKTVDMGAVNAIHIPRIHPAVNGAESEHVASGWPVWLASVAGEAIRGWLPRRLESFQKFEKIGEGTYSTVFKGRDLETGEVVSLKQVRFVNIDPQSVRFMAREIIILRKLDHPNIIKLKGLIASTDSTHLHLVFDYMEHDLTGFLANPSIVFTESQIKCYMRQLFRGLNHCHSRGILHRDIKGSNLLIDNNGILRIADFGLATFFGPNWKQPLTSRVVTLWYRAPELLLGSTEYGVSVDLWSVGCILAEIFAGKPIMPGRTEVEQMHKIFKLCGSPSNEYFTNPKFPNTTIFKPIKHYKRCLHEMLWDLPSPVWNLVDSLLTIKPEDRGTAAAALSSQFFTTKPYACDPSSLPTYPPSKEMDVKLRNWQSKRLKEMASKDNNASGYQRNRIKDTHQPEVQKTGIHFNERPNLNGTAKIAFHRSGELHSAALSFGSSSTMKKDNNNNCIVVSPRRMPSTTNATKMRGYGPDHELKMPRSHIPHDYVGTSETQGWNNQIIAMPSTSYRRIERRNIREPLPAGSDRRIIEYSGPLMPRKGGAEVMLGEHDRKIQDAARKSRLDRAKEKMDCIGE